MGLVAGNVSIVEEVLLAYRGLFLEEARLGEALAKDGGWRGASIAEQWPAIHDHLQLYGRGLGRAGVLVLAGSPDEGSRLTGLPFMGPADARTRLGLTVAGDQTSPQSSAFWDAVGDIGPDMLFSAALVAHANPFDAPLTPMIQKAAAAHVGALLQVARPQAVVTVGAEALSILGATLRNRDLVDLAAAPAATPLSRWPPGTPFLCWPTAEVALSPPYRIRVAPLPSLTGAHAREATASLRALLDYFAG